MIDLRKKFQDGLEIVLSFVLANFDSPEVSLSLLLLALGSILLSAVFVRLTKSKENGNLLMLLYCRLVLMYLGAYVGLGMF